MAKNLANKKITEFWKEVSAANNHKTPLPDTINEACGSEEITTLWKNISIKSLIVLNQTIQHRLRTS